MNRVVTIFLAVALLAVSCQKQEQEELARLQQEAESLAAGVGDTASPSANADVPQDGDFFFTFDKTKYGVNAGSDVSVAFSLQEKADVEVLVKEGWSAKVNYSSETGGEIVLTCPDPAVYADVVAVATAPDGKKTSAKINLMIRDPYSDSTRPRLETVGYYFRTFNATPENIQRLADAGISIITVEGEDYGFESLMDLCRQYGIKVLLIVGGYAGRAYENRDAYYGELVDFINRMKDRPELFGWWICDEPSIEDAPRVKAMKDMVEELDPDHPVYLNYHPNASSGSLGVDSYYDYINLFTDYLDQDLISFDIYPIYPGRIQSDWHYCLQIVADAARRHGVPFWTFAASCWIDSEGEAVRREKPNKYNELLQIYTSLAFGSQCMQYFTMSAYGGTTYAPFMYDNTVTAAYDALKDANTRMLKRSFVFKDCNVTKIRSTGEKSTFDTRLAVTDYPECLKSFDSTYSVLVSFVENKGNEYIVVVNNYWSVDQIVSIEFTDSYYLIDQEGVFTEYEPGLTHFLLEKGEMLVFKYK